MFHCLGIVLLAVGTVYISVQNVSGAESLVIALKEEASVHSGTILLKDVADLQGTDVSTIEKLSQLSLGPSPEYGSVKILSRHQISQFIQASAGPLHGEEFSGAAAVCVRVKGRDVGPEDIAPLLKTSLQAHSSWKESEIEIRSIGNLKGIEIPPGAGLRLSSGDAIMRQRSALVPVEIVKDGRVLRSFWITADITAHAEILVAAKRITLGKTVQPGDFEIKALPVADLRAVYARTLDEVVGKTAGRLFSPGDPITRDSFANPLLVKSGETVQLRLERKGIVLLSQARAEQDGQLGQVIRVRNLDFPAVVKAQVMGRSQVMVQ